MEPHRTFVGGDFEAIGKWQFNYLINQVGISPSDVFLDIACGCLRLGRHIIPYLDKNNYYGLEADRRILEAGIQHELGPTDRTPNFSINSVFDFDFCKSYNVAWANSLLTHLTVEDIKVLFINLRKISTNTSRFYFTYFDKTLAGVKAPNPEQSHARKDFFYEYNHLIEILSETGWEGKKCEVQNHPRKQQIVCALIK